MCLSYAPKNRVFMRLYTNSHTQNGGTVHKTTLKTSMKKGILALSQWRVCRVRRGWLMWPLTYVVMVLVTLSRPLRSILRGLHYSVSYHRIYTKTTYFVEVLF